MKNLLLFCDSIMGVVMTVGLLSTGNPLFSVGLGAVGISMLFVIND